MSMIEVSGPVRTTAQAGSLPHRTRFAAGSMRQMRNLPGVAGKPISSPT